MRKRKWENHVVYLAPFHWNHDTLIFYFNQLLRKHKLSRRRGTPWYRHRDAWAKRSPLLTCLRRLYDAGGKAWDKIRNHQKFIEEMR